MKQHQTLYIQNQNSWLGFVLIFGDFSSLFLCAVQIHLLYSKLLYR